MLSTLRTLSSLSLKHFVLQPTSGLAAVVGKRTTNSAPHHGALLDLSVCGCTVPSASSLAELLLGSAEQGHTPCPLQHLDASRLHVHSAGAYAGLHRLTLLRSLLLRQAACVDDVVCFEVRQKNALFVTKSGHECVWLTFFWCDDVELVE